MVVGGGTPVCEWCSAPLTGGQIVACSPSHRLKRWKWLHGIPDAHGHVEEPPARSLLLAGSDRQRAVQRQKHGGLQVSVGRMLRSLQGPPAYLNEQAARDHVARALPEAQRARFEEPAVVPGQLEMEDVA